MNSKVAASAVDRLRIEASIDVIDMIVNGDREEVCAPISAFVFHPQLHVRGWRWPGARHAGRYPVLVG